MSSIIVRFGKFCKGKKKKKKKKKRNEISFKEVYNIILKKKTLKITIIPEILH
jgi:hypothetical protein